MATVLERVKKVVVDRLSVEEDKVVPEARFTDDLEADSLDLVELIMAFEEEFSTPENKLEISDQDAGMILTIQDAVNYLKQHGIADP